MKLLIYGLHFKPDLIGIGKYTGEMADWLNENNYNIRVITAPHFYPKWKRDNKQFLYKKIDKPYTVWRCPIYVPKNPSAMKRLLHYISFSISSFPVLIRIKTMLIQLNIGLPKHIRSFTMISIRKQMTYTLDI